MATRRPGGRQGVSGRGNVQPAFTSQGRTSARRGGRQKPPIVTPSAIGSGRTSGGRGVLQAHGLRTNIGGLSEFDFTQGIPRGFSFTTRPGQRANLSLGGGRNLRLAPQTTFNQSFSNQSSGFQNLLNALLGRNINVDSPTGLPSIRG